jgi:hypothetical protein
VEEMVVYGLEEGEGSQRVLGDDETVLLPLALLL